MHHEANHKNEAKRAYVEEIRRHTRWEFLNVFGLASWVLKGKPYFFDASEHLKSPQGDALREARYELERASEAYAEARTQRRRTFLGNAAESKELRSGIEVANAAREARMSLFEEGLSKSIRWVLKKKERALPAAVITGSVLWYVYSPMVIAAGAWQTTTLMGVGAYNGIRILGRYSHYVYNRLRYSGLRAPKQHIWEFAKKYNRQRDIAAYGTIFGGAGFGSLVATEWADAAAEWGGLHSQHELIRETIPDKREKILHAIEVKRGAPEYIYPEKEAETLDAALSETDIVETARHSSALLQGIYERISLFRAGKFFLLNKARNEALLAEGLIHAKRLETLEAARVRYEALSQRGADTITLAFLKKTLGDLEGERTAVKEWADRFDAATNAGAERFNADHHEGLAELSVDYLTAHTASKEHSISMPDLFPSPSPVEALPLTSGDLSQESFNATASAVSSRLRTIDEVLDHYRRIIGNDGRRYLILEEARSRSMRLNSQLEALRPYFSGYSSLHSEIGAVDSHQGEDLTEALLRERVRQIDFAAYEESWPAVIDASHALSRITPGTVLLDDVVTPIRQVVNFKEGVQPYFPQAMSHTVYELNQKLQDLGLPPITVSEGHPALAFHISTCHQDGTCADFAFADREYSPERIWKVFQTVDNEHNFAIWESGSASGAAQKSFELRNFLIARGISAPVAEKLVQDRIKHFAWTTGEHFHFQCKHCEGAGAPVSSLVDANDNAAEAIPYAAGF